MTPRYPLARVALVALALFLSAAAAEARAAEVSSAPGARVSAPACQEVTSGCLKVQLLTVTTNANGTTTYSFRIIYSCANGLSNAAFELPAGVTATSPTTGGLIKKVENPGGQGGNNASFRNIKFEFNGDIKGGASVDLSFTLPAGAMYSNDLLRVRTKGGQATQSLALDPTSCENVCADESEDPSFDGVLIRDGNRRLVEVEAPRGTTSIEFYNTTNLNFNDPSLIPENPDGSSIPGVTKSTTGRGGTLYTFSAPVTEVRFPLLREDATKNEVSFFIAVKDKCLTVDLDPQYVLDAEGPMGAVLSAGVSPNPSVGRATVQYGLAEAGPATVAVYDALGRRVAVLADGAHSAGAHEAVWEAGPSIPAGVYVVRVQAGNGVQTARMTLVR